MIIIQGNTYDFPVKLKIRGADILDKDVKKVEFSFENVKKTYPKNVSFDGSHFIVSLTQEDTLSLSTRRINNYQVRALFNDGRVKSTNPVEFIVVESESREVL
jgi:vancomycin resistance protein YoaR